ncbi:transglutaminase domain-containing protein [Propionibacteriaceae bacterium G57]|uniref:transglutaminase domain-containing protein n=1 Tax=Aestuariimicrobium sp. G57 TaxID=3418485 RepID=UPI003DA6E29A
MGVIARLLKVAAVAGAVAGPVWARAPKGERIAPDGVHTLDEATSAAQSSGLSGWELVDHVTGVVHRKFSYYSCYHWWESPAEAFARSRGQSNQYNLALASVLRRLGFEVRTVHASRVRLQRSPWWHAGHTWLEVTIDGITKDVCASRAENRAGQVTFVPVTPVRLFRGLTYVDTTLGLALIVVVVAWRAWLNGEPLPRWVYRPFNEAASTEGWHESRRGA